MKLWEGKEAPEKTGRGWEAVPSSEDDKNTAMGFRDSWGEALNLSSVASNLLCDPGRDQNSPQKNGSYIISACQRRVLFQTLKHYIKKKKSETQGKEGKRGL